MDEEVRRAVDVIQGSFGLSELLNRHAASAGFQRMLARQLRTALTYDLRF
jgi:hypothetical protein